MKSKLFRMVVVLLVVCSAMSLADEADAWWGSWYSQGNVALSVRAAIENPRGYAIGFGVYPGAEIILLKPDFGAVAPLDFGVGARGHLGVGLDRYLENPISAGLGVVGTAHLGFRGLDFIDPGILRKLEYFVEMGIGFDLIRHFSGGTLYDFVNFIAFTGVNYHLSPAFAVTAGYTRWGSASGVSIGAQLRLGPSPTITALEVRAPSGRVVTPGQIMMAQVYVAQFYALYWYAFTAGGLYFDDSTYRVGDGTVWHLTGSDDEEGFLLEKALLREEADGSRWWRVAFTADRDRFVYEYLVGPDYRLIEMMFLDVSENRVGEYVFTGREAMPYAAVAVEPITPEDYDQYRVRSERLRVRAGSFNTELLQHRVTHEETWSYSWWVSGEVPGSLVKFSWDLSDRDDWMEGELVEITRGNRPELIDD